MRTLEEITTEIRNRMSQAQGVYALAIDVAELPTLLEAADFTVNYANRPTMTVARATVVTNDHSMDSVALVIGATSPLIGQECSADVLVHCSKGHGVQWVLDNFGIVAEVVNRGGL
jgi:hypothetical protein